MSSDSDDDFCFKPKFGVFSEYVITKAMREKKYFNLCCNLKASSDEHEQFAMTKDFFSDGLKKCFKGTIHVYSPMQLTEGLKGEKEAEYAEMLRSDGHAKFCKRSYWRALYYYNQSIACYPPTDTAGLPLTYAARSLVLLKIGELFHAVEDIDRALNCGYPETVSYKLHERKVEALKLLGKDAKAILEAIDKAIASVEISGLKKKAKQEHIEELNKNREEVIQDMRMGKVAKNARKRMEKVKRNIYSCQKPPALSYGANSEVSGVSDCLVLSYNKELGRHYIADRDIKPGDVLVVEPSFANVVLPGFFYTHCCHCAKRCGALLPCDNCTWAMYCSKDCQRAGAHVHSFECSLMNAFSRWRLGKFCHLIFRIVATVGIPQLHQFLLSMKTKQPTEQVDPRSCGMVDGKYTSSLFSIYNLSRHTDFPTVMQALDKCAVAFILTECMKDLLPDYDLFGAFFLRLYTALSLNAWSGNEIYQTSKDVFINHVSASIGVAVSFFSHSCNPTSMNLTYENGVHVVRALQPAKKGSVVSISYGYKYWMSVKPFRLLTLKDKYGFKCNCEACAGDWQTLRPGLKDTSAFFPEEYRTEEETDTCKVMVGKTKELFDKVRNGNVLNAKEAAVMGKFIQTFWECDVRCYGYNVAIDALADHFTSQACCYQDNFS